MDHYVLLLVAYILTGNCILHFPLLQLPGLTRIYTKRRGQPPDLKEPVVLTYGRYGINVEALCDQVWKYNATATRMMMQSLVACAICGSYCAWWFTVLNRRVRWRSTTTTTTSQPPPTSVTTRPLPH